MQKMIKLVFLLLAVSFATAEIKNKGWWKNAVIYQIYPRSFMDWDNDGIGDLTGITSKLEHLMNCGVGAVWLSPIYASPMVDFGYDISDFKDVASEYGTMRDFERLVARAKSLGLKVILDLVPNHSSDQHEWFKKSVAGIGKYKDYYVWRTGRNNNKSPPNNWISVFTGPAWTYSASRGQWYLHQFEYRQPDLNYSNPDVRAEMEEVIRFWLRKGVDGFRVDAVPHIYERDHLRDEPRSFIPGKTDRDYEYLDHIFTRDDPRTYDLVKSWRDVLDEYADTNNEDEKILMTEAYTTLENTTKFYKFGVQIPFNFKLISDVNSASNATDYKKAIDSWLAKTTKDEVANWVTGNHDCLRAASRFPGRADQTTMFVMILPGVAVTYYGDELGMVSKSDISWEDTQDPPACNAGKEKYQTLSRDPHRTPFQWDDTFNAGFSKANHTWLPVHRNYKDLNRVKQLWSPDSHLNVYTSLIRLRKTQQALQRGSTRTSVLNNEKVLAVSREIPGQSIILVTNFADNSAQTVNLSGHATLYNRTVIEIASVGSGIPKGMAVNPLKVNVPAKASLVLNSFY